MMNDDDDLPPAGLDLAGYFRVLAARLGRRPTLGEVAIFRHDVCAERWKRIQRRRAARKAARRVPAARGGNRGGKSPDPVRELFTSFEWLAAMSLMFSLVMCITELASLRLSGRRITMPKADLVAAAAALPAVLDERDPESLGLPPHPLGSYTPNSVMLGFRAVHERRAAEATELFGHPHYGRALAMLLRSSGAPIGTVEGADPWEIVRETDPAVCDYLRTLGSDPSEWGTLKIQVGQAQSKAAQAARDNHERGPAYVDRMMQLASPQGAAAYCAWKFWRPLGEAKADENELDGVDLEAAPVSTVKEPANG